jgi:isoleucyl-tRNA synthetase
VDVLPMQDGERELVERWKAIREIRSAVQRALEERRAAGEIGSSLQAEVEVDGRTPADTQVLRSMGEDLKFVFITSSATVGPETGAEACGIRVRASAHPKCERCWHYRADIGSDARHPTICGRCVTNLEGAGEARAHA